jgi:hypothetical protein
MYKIRLFAPKKDSILLGTTNSAGFFIPIQRTGVRLHKDERHVYPTSSKNAENQGVLTKSSGLRNTKNY